MKTGQPSAYLSFTLHAHLPYVIHHGTWPHGLEWLHEAAAESYLPLLAMLRRLERGDIPIRFNLSLSPVLMEQLTHPTFQAEFPRYLERKMLSAREDENYFRQSGEHRFAETAHFWLQFFERTLHEFRELECDIVGAFRYYHDMGAIEIIACAATHGYLPLLATDESIAAQVAIGVSAYQHYFGSSPRGMWIPECGYRPAGLWHAPVISSGEQDAGPSKRTGIDQALTAAGIQYFFVDTHLVEESIQFTPYQMRSGERGLQLHNLPAQELRGDLEAVHRPYLVKRQAAEPPITIFPRDPKTGLQVWSGDTGYPADGNYLDFHKKRWPGGLQYWQVTQAQSEMDRKAPYYPEEARERTRVHAEHFVALVYDSLKPGFDPRKPPVMASLFDAELFGHWWFEGPLWLEEVARIFSKDEIPIALTTASEFLEKFPATTSLKLGEGSWGKNGNNEVWLNKETSWTWAEIYRAERVMREIAGSDHWRESPWGTRLAQQIARELLLLESSDWQFLITTAAARDYAEKRFFGHLTEFTALERLWAEFLAKSELSAAAQQLLQQMEERDSLFPNLDPALWATR